MEKKRLEKEPNNNNNNNNKDLRSYPSSQQPQLFGHLVSLSPLHRSLVRNWNAYASSTPLKTLWHAKELCCDKENWWVADSYMQLGTEDRTSHRDFYNNFQTATTWRNRHTAFCRATASGKSYKISNENDYWWMSIKYTICSKQSIGSHLKDVVTICQMRGFKKGKKIEGNKSHCRNMAKKFIIFLLLLTSV